MSHAGEEKDSEKVMEVPGAHQAYAASYKFGYTEGFEGRDPQGRARFASAEAWSAYQAGWGAGCIARHDREREAAANATITGPLFSGAGETSDGE
jgi:hypothetical protein